MGHLTFVLIIFAFLATADINDSTFSDSTLGSAAKTYAEQIAFFNRTTDWKALDDSGSVHPRAPA